MRITVEELFEFADYVKCWWESADAELDEKTASLRMEVESLTEERNEANAKVDELEEEVKSTTALWDWRKKTIRAAGERESRASRKYHLVARRNLSPETSGAGGDQ